MGFSIHNRIMYLWQKEEWPGFTWKSEEIIGILARTARTEAALIGKMEASGQDAQKALATDAMTEEIVASSSIEGIVFDRSSVRSSILLHLGLKPEHTIPMHRNESQAAAILIDAISNRWDPLTEKRLFQETDTQNIQQTAYQIDSHYGQQHMQPQVRGIIIRGILQKVFPKPLPHHARIGMDQQHAERGGGKQVDPAVIAHRDAAEETQRHFLTGSE